MRMKLKYKIRKIAENDYRLRDVGSNKILEEKFTCYEDAKFGLWMVSDNSEYYEIVSGGKEYKEKLAFVEGLMKGEKDER